jgi:hypothetical protein
VRHAKVGSNSRYTAAWTNSPKAHLLTHLLTWLYGPLRTSASFTTHVLSSLSLAFCFHLFSFSSRKSFTTYFSHLNLSLSNLSYIFCSGNVCYLLGLVIYNKCTFFSVISLFRTPLHFTLSSIILYILHPGLHTCLVPSYLGKFIIYLLDPTVL